MNTSKIKAEYLWIDGQEPTAEIRGKTKVLEGRDYTLGELPVWGYDGSSTEQAEGHSSDVVLRPVKVVKDPLRNTGDEVHPHLLVLCATYTANGEPLASNTRHGLEHAQKKYGDYKFQFGLEQEYTLFDGKVPLGWPKNGEDFKEAQGRFYCAAGADVIFGREFAEEHLDACLRAGLGLTGINAEVMPGQWEYQVFGDALNAADDLWLARYIANRIGEKYGVTVSLEAKPREGDWNGAGMHTNFSTEEMRSVNGAVETIFPRIIAKMQAAREAHLAVYGTGIESRLTGKHETCSYKEFKAGVSDRGASIRIPWQVAKNGKGYMEDRRPCADMDPYKGLAQIMKTVAGE